MTGCIDAQKAHFIYAAGEAVKKKLIVTYSELRAKELCENYRLFDKNVLFYPAKDLIFYSADVQSNLLVQQRIRVLQKLMEEEEVTISRPWAHHGSSSAAESLSKADRDG